MHEDEFKGTGDQIAEAEILGGLLTLRATDDGYNDKDLSVALFDEDGNRQSLQGILTDYRVEHGDGDLKEMLEAEFEDVDAEDFEARPRPSFKCDHCNRTWPRGKNYGDGDEDCCPECA